MAKYFARSGIIGIAALALAGCAAPNLKQGLQDFYKPNTSRQEMVNKREECYLNVDGSSHQLNVNEAYKKAKMLELAQF